MSEINLDDKDENLTIDDFFIYALTHYPDKGTELTDADTILLQKLIAGTFNNEDTECIKNLLKENIIAYQYLVDYTQLAAANNSVGPPESVTSAILSNHTIKSVSQSPIFFQYFENLKYSGLVAAFASFAVFFAFFALYKNNPINIEPVKESTLMANDDKILQKNNLENQDRLLNSKSEIHDDKEIKDSINRSQVATLDLSEFTNYERTRGVNGLTITLPATIFADLNFDNSKETGIELRASLYKVFIDALKNKDGKRFNSETNIILDREIPETISNQLTKSGDSTAINFRILTKGDRKFTIIQKKYPEIINNDCVIILPNINIVHPNKIN